MRIKILFVLSVVVTLVLWLYLDKHITTEKLVKVESVPVSSLVPVQQSVIKEIKTEADAQAQKSEIVVEPEPDPEPLDQAVYDDDPVVDAHLLMSQHRMCYLLMDQNQGVSMNERLTRRLNARQRQFITKHKNYCQNLHRDNPTYYLDNIDALNKQKNKAAANSLWGQIIAGEVDEGSLNEHQVRELLRQNDLNILSDAPLFLSNHYQEVIHWGLEDVLQNRHYDYVDLIRSYAHQMHLCNLGTDCGMNSTTMVRLCLVDANNCGLSFQQYHDQILSVGQQSDVALALRYLQGQYQ